MTDHDDLMTILDRIAKRITTEADVATLRSALQEGQIAIATGERAIAAGGNITDAVIVAGNGNVVHIFKGQDAAIIQRVFLTPAAPLPPPHFVGREADLAFLAKALKTEGTPQVIYSICGMGGIGKTALAKQLAARCADAFPGGVFWADLPANIGDPMPILDTWAQLCDGDVSTCSKLEVRASVVQSMLKERAKRGRLLVILDDVRADWFNGARILLQYARPPGVPALLTTRDVELAQNLDAIPRTLDVLSPDQALELLVCLAGQTVISQEHDAAYQLAKLVGCLPLALELAGKLIQRYSGKHNWWLTHLCKQIEERTAIEVLLRPKGERVLVATFSLSYETLNSAEQRLFRVLGTLAPVPVDAKHLTIILGSKVTEDELDALQALSLVQWELGMKTAGVRYTLHPLLHEFAAQSTPEGERESFQRELEDNVIASLRDPAHCHDRVVAEASLLIRLDWLTHIQGVSIDELLTYLELIAPYVGASGDRKYLANSITPMLTSPSISLSGRQRAQLLIYRAAMLAQLGESEQDADKLNDAERDYEKAGQLISNLPGSGDSGSEDLRLLARINLGAGSVASARAEMLTSPKAQDLQRGIQRAVNLYLEAAKSAKAYGRDAILVVNIYKELAYNYALLKKWAKAEKYCRSALSVLEKAEERVEDPAAYVSCYAQVLETANQIHLKKGQSKTSEALLEYETAHKIACEEIKMLEERIDELGELLIGYDLALAHINAGDPLLEMHKFPNCRVSDPLVKACEHWRTALDMARRLHISEIEQWSTERLDQHCQSNGEIRQGE